MRLVTRSDFDGLACAVLLKAAGLVTEYKFVHPKDLQDGLVEVNSNDIMANVPYVEGCGMWFDHHSSEYERVGNIKYEGLSKISPSCARVIWEYFGGHAKFSPFLDPMLAAVDKVDSGDLSPEDTLNPQGWVLLGLMMDPRTGLGRYRDYRISNYQLMLDMIDHCGTKTAEELLVVPDVQDRTKRYFSQQEQFLDMVRRCARVEGNLVVLDLRNEEEIFSGNRFILYSVFPDCNVSLQVMWGLKQQNVVFTVGYSNFNRSCTVDVGSLMLAHGGGGHQRVGTCQIATERADEILQELVKALRG